MISVRQHQYRGVEGFLICGRRKEQVGGFGVSIFCLTKPIAIGIREAAKAANWTQIDDLLRSETMAFNGKDPRRKK